MPLSCYVALSKSSCQAEGSPPMAAVVVTNPTATALSVIGGRLTVTQLGGDSNVSRPGTELPIGPGMATLVPAGGTIVMSPLPVVVHSAAACNSFQAVTGDTVLPGGQNAHVRMPGPAPQFTVLVGATLQASDGSINEAATAPLLVDVAVPPPLGWQGGTLSLEAPNNLVTYLAGVL